jgi:hypothetical protein
LVSSKVEIIPIFLGDNYNKMDLREIGWGDMDWTDLAEDWDQWRALVNMEMNLQVP